MQDEISDQAVKAAQLQEREELLAEFSAKIDGPRMINAVEKLPTSHAGALCTYILDALLKDTSIAHPLPQSQTRQPGNLAPEKRTLSSELLSILFSGHLLVCRSISQRSRIRTTGLRASSEVNHNYHPQRLERQLQSFASIIQASSDELSQSNQFHSHCLEDTISVLPLFCQLYHRPQDQFSSSTRDHHFHQYSRFERIYNSKYIAERLLDNAARTRRIRTSLARVSQVAGVVRNPGL
jgi:hypothetical protein